MQDLFKQTGKSIGGTLSLSLTRQVTIGRLFFFNLCRTVER